MSIAKRWHGCGTAVLSYIATEIIDWIGHI